MAVKDAVRVNLAVKMVYRMAIFSRIICSRRKVPLVSRRSRNRPGIHKSHGRDLSVLDLGALTVREVTCGMTDGEGIVGRGVACAEAGAAECRLDNSARLHQIRQCSILRQLHVDRRAGRIYA